jgi:hypothetical protein
MFVTRNQRLIMGEHEESLQKAQLSPLPPKPSRPLMPPPPQELHPLVHEAMAKDICLLLLGLRFINALAVGTFFQPDEYFQSLEPAWQMAFGAGSGAWITWVSGPVRQL